MVPQTINSIILIININILKLNLSIKNPHINLVPPFTSPNKNPIKKRASCPTIFLFPKILYVFVIKKQKTKLFKINFILLTGATKTK